MVFSIDPVPVLTVIIPQLPCSEIAFCLSIFLNCFWERFPHHLSDHSSSFDCFQDRQEQAGQRTPATKRPRTKLGTAVLPPRGLSIKSAAPVAGVS